MVIYLTVNKKSDSPLTYNYVDSQRLREAFFSPPKKRTISKKKKNFPPKIILFSISSLIVLLGIGASLFFLNYDFLIIPHQDKKLDGISILRNNTSSFSLSSSDKRTIKASTSSIYVTIPNKEKTNVTIWLKKAVNLNNNPLFLYVKKTNVPLKMGVVVRDTSFFSNSLNPLVIELKNADTSSYVKIPIEFKGINLQNTNLSNINQISFSFYPLDNNNASATEKSAFNKNWVLIKDLILMKKGG